MDWGINTMNLIGPEAERILFLAGRGGKDDHMGAEGLGELHSHVPEPAKTDHADLLPVEISPAADRRPGGDPGAEQRRDSGKLEEPAARWRWLRNMLWLCTWSVLLSSVQNCLLVEVTLLKKKRSAVGRSC